MEPLLVTFAGGSSGLWRVERIEAVRGAAAFPSRTACCDRRARRKDPGGLRLDPARGNKQRTLRRRRRARRAGRPPAVPRAAGGDVARPLREDLLSLLLRQVPPAFRIRDGDERSARTRIGLEYLPAVARRLHHGRDLAEEFEAVNRSCTPCSFR